jgi:O-antigen/teichoic acid export membrane protein
VPPGEGVGSRPGAPAVEAIRSASALSGGLWSTTGTVASQIYTIIGSVLTARFLGQAAVGRVSFIALVEGTMFVLLSQGLPRAVMRFTGESVGRGAEHDVGDLFSWSTRLGTAAALASGAVLAGAGLLGAQPRWAWMFAGVACAASVLQSYPGAFLTGIQRWRTVTLAGLVPVTGGIIAKVVALSLGAGVSSLFAIDASTSLVTLLATFILARSALRSLTRSAVRNRRLHADVLRFAAISTLGILVTFVVWRRTEIFFLEHYSTDGQVALYSVAFSVVSGLLVIPQGAAAVLAPAFATLLGARAHDRIAAALSRALRIMVLVSVFLTAATMALGPTLLRLVYGGAFRGTNHVLLVLLLPLPLVALMYTCLPALLGLRKQWFAIASDAVAAVLNLAFDAILIPGHGALAAATANALAQTLGSIPVIVYTIRVADGTRLRSLTLMRGMFAAAPAGAVGWLAVQAFGGAMGVVAGALAAAAVWVAGLVLLRGLEPDDADWVRASLRRGRLRRAAEGTSS